MVQTECEFWDYSLSLYGAADVSEHCLTLQNQFGFDVNLLLFCIWYGKFHGPMSPSLLEEAIAMSGKWRTGIVQPLRDVRTTMKGNKALAEEMPAPQYEQLRAEIKRLELDAEKMQQEALQRLARKHQIPDSMKERQDAPLANLISLSQQLQANPEQSLIHLQAMVEASNNLA